MSTDNRDFKILNDREHVLLRPGMYLGQTSLTEKEMWVYNKETNKFSFETIQYVPALLKYISEIIDNSVDVAIDTDFKYANKIQVNITDTSVEVIDNGIGIPCTDVNGALPAIPTESCVVAAWTKLKSGTSFTKNRKKIGTNGVGASCCNIFSKVFIGISDDGTYKQKITCKDNMSVIQAGKLEKSSGKSGARVYCEPDLERFNLDSITDVHINLVYQRLLCLAIAYPQITFIFNKEKIKLDNKKFANMFSDNYEIAASDNTTIIVFPNEYDEFKSFSQVNGVETFRGGEHVDYVTKIIANGVRDKLVKKYKELRPGDVKTRLCIAVILTDFEDPQFDAQTKESLSNSAGEISKHIDGKVDFEKLIKNILKNEAIINPIVDTFRIKEELKSRNELKKTKKAKVTSDKYMPPIGKEKKYIFLCEGDSAQSGLSASLGRDGIAYYAMKGLPLNAYSSSMQKIAANQEFKDIMNILGLDITASDDEKKIDFDKIVIGADSDLDANHITAMHIGWYKRFAPNLFKEGKICRLITPIVITTDKDEHLVDYFFTLDEFKDWETKHPENKNKIVYLKGLGSWEIFQLTELIDRIEFESLIQPYRLDDRSNVYIEDWLGEDAEKRKVYLRQYDFDIDQL